MIDFDELAKDYTEIIDDILEQDEDIDILPRLKYVGFLETFIVKLVNNKKDYGKYKN